MYKLIFKNSFRLGAKNFHFPKYKTFFQSVLFSFFKFGKFCLLKYKEFYRSFCFRSIRKFLKVDFLYFSSMGLKSAGFHFQKYKKSFNLTVRKFYFLKYNEFFLGGWNFFFSSLSWKVHQLSLYITTSATTTTVWDRFKEIKQNGKVTILIRLYIIFVLLLFRTKQQNRW